MCNYVKITPTTSSGLKISNNASTSQKTTWQHPTLFTLATILNVSETLLPHMTCIGCYICLADLTVNGGVHVLM